MRVTKTADESAIARMIAMVEDAQSQKAETQRLIDRFEQPYALGVIAMTAVAIALPILGWGEAFRPAFYRAMTLMVAASPCALVISTPAAVLSAIAAAARSGVLFKGGVTVEEAARVRAVAFDKTGTLTAGETRLTDVVALGARDDDALVALAAAVQARSEHHLARATVREAEARGWPSRGRGLRGRRRARRRGRRRRARSCASAIRGTPRGATWRASRRRSSKSSGCAPRRARRSWSPRPSRASSGPSA